MRGAREEAGGKDATQVVNKALNMRQERRVKLLAVVEYDALKRLCPTSLSSRARLRQRSGSAPELQLGWNIKGLQSHIAG